MADEITNEQLRLAGEENKRLREERDSLWEQAELRRLAADALAARLAAAEKVVEAARKWRNVWPERGYETQYGLVDALVAAVDAYRTHEPEETHHG